MTRAKFWALMALLLFWLAGTAPAVSATTGASAPSSERRLLVMLRLPPDHEGLGSDSGGGYGESPGHAARRRFAGGLAKANGLTVIDDWPMPLLGVDCFVMEAPEGRSAVETAERLSREKGVAWAQPVGLYRTGASPAGDTLYRFQPAARLWRLADLHQVATGRGVRVAVVDSRIQANHPDLLGQIETSQNFVTDHSLAAERHGTAVAGIIAARAGEGGGIVGVAPSSRLMALRACWQTGSAPGAPTLCDSLTLALALHYAVEHGAQVVNLSLSGPPDVLLGRLVDIAIARGATVVGAYDPALAGGGFPASHAGVVAVADAESAEARSPGVFAAPGRDIPTTQPGGRWFLVSGDSYAAAHVSGLFALMRERDRRARSGAALVATRGGGIDACASVLRAAGPCACGCARTENAVTAHP